MTTPAETSASTAASGTAAAEAAQNFRLSQAVMSATLIRDVMRLWLTMDTRNIRESWPALKSGLVSMITGQNARSASAGLGYYASARTLAGLPGYTPVTAIEPPELKIISGTLDAVGPYSLLGRIKQQQPLDQAMQNTGVRLGGAVSKLALDGARQAIVQNVQADPAAVGWQRITSGSPCAFCAMLADRGAVYKDEDSADFSAHDHCSCTAAPVFSDAEAAALRPSDEWRQVTKGLSGKAAMSTWRKYIDSGRNVQN